MVMRYHWGLGVGHAYAHGQGVSSKILQNQTGKADGHDEEENDWNGDHDSFSDLSDNSRDEGGSDIGSESTGSSLDDDFEDYDTLDYQN